MLLPRYRDVPLPPSGPIVTFPVQVGPHGFSVAIYEIVRHNVRCLFADLPASLFDRAGLYGAAGVDFPDNRQSASRWLCQAALGVARSGFSSRRFSCPRLAGGLSLPVYLRWKVSRWIQRSSARSGAFLQSTTWATQAKFSGQPRPPTLVSIPGCSIRKGWNFSAASIFWKAGIVWSDAVNAVSPDVCPAKSRLPNSGSAFDGTSRARASKLSGILNGVDYDEWNPETDRHLPVNYSASDLSGKRACKLALLEEMGLPPDADRPLIGIVSRFAHQKGIDMVAETLLHLRVRGWWCSAREKFLRSKTLSARWRATILTASPSAHRLRRRAGASG